MSAPIQSVSGWAQEIRYSLGRSVEAIIEVGNTINKCKVELPHGQFQDAVQLAGISPRVAQMFMAVADNPVLSNTSIYSQLPGAYNTLYALSRLDAPILQEAIGNGTVTPVMTLAEAKTLISQEPKTWEGCMRAGLDALEEAYAGVDEIADPNEALRVMKAIIKLAGRAQNMAAEHKLRLERKAGQVLAAADLKRELIGDGSTLESIAGPVEINPELVDLMEHEAAIEAGLAKLENLVIESRSR